jgi:hypothetical protein
MEDIEYYRAVKSHIERNSVLLVGTRTIWTERPSLVDEVNINFCWVGWVVWSVQWAFTAVNIGFLNWKDILI